jgi:hypothetical protein
VYRVSPAGKSTLFFKTDQAHIRSMLIDKGDDLLVGTDPGGLLIRVPASGAPGFVLYQSAKKEITALATGPDGTLYAAGVGTRGGPAPAVAPSPAPAAPATQTAASTLGGQTPALRVDPVPQSSPLPSTLRTSVTGGAEVFRIGLDGEPRRLWSGDEIVYTLAFNQLGKLLAGTGNRGRIFEIDSEHFYSLLIKAAPTQVTMLLPGKNGAVYAATGNVGKVYRLGPELEPKGTFESEVFDARIFSHWGRLNWKGTTAPSSKLTLYARSGNLNTPDQYWSQWSKPIASAEGAPLDCPPARFVQWKAVLETTGTASPLLDSVSIAYQSKNVPPSISEVEVTPPNYRFAEPTASGPSISQTLSLPAFGSRPAPHTGSSAPQAPRSMNRAKGFLAARWQPQDENDDQMIFKVEICGLHEQNWKLLKDKVEQPYLSWDSTAFADGFYQIRVTVSDAPSNTGTEALSTSKESDPFYIDNTPPALSNLTAIAEGGRLRVRFHAGDALSDISNSEYSTDGGEWKMMLPATRLFDSKDLDYDFLTDTVMPGEHTVAIRVADENDNVSAAKAVVK